MEGQCLLKYLMNSFATLKSTWSELKTTLLSVCPHARVCLGGGVEDTGGVVEDSRVQNISESRDSFLTQKIHTSSCYQSLPLP